MAKKTQNPPKNAQRAPGFCTGSSFSQEILLLRPYKDTPTQAIPHMAANPRHSAARGQENSGPNAAASIKAAYTENPTRARGRAMLYLKNKGSGSR